MSFIELTKYLKYGSPGYKYPGKIILNTDFIVSIESKGIYTLVVLKDRREFKVKESALYIKKIIEETENNE